MWTLLLFVWFTNGSVSIMSSPVTDHDRPNTETACLSVKAELEKTYKPEMKDIEAWKIVCVEMWRRSA